LDNDEKKAEASPTTKSHSRPKPLKISPTKKDGKNDSDEEIASPQIKNLKLAHVKQTIDEMRSSKKLYLKDSIRP
jgi:hypothetical protein